MSRQTFPFEVECVACHKAVPAGAPVEVVVDSGVPLTYHGEAVEGCGWMAPEPVAPVAEADGLTTPSGREVPEGDGEAAVEPEGEALADERRAYLERQGAAVVVNPVPVVVKAAGTGRYVCPYCGTDTNPKDGVRFDAQKRPGYSLGNHKRQCPMKGEAHAAVVAVTPPPPVAPVTVETAPPVTPAAPVPARPAAPEHHAYSTALTGERVVAEAEFAARMSTFTPLFSAYGKEVLAQMEYAAQTRDPIKGTPTPVVLLGPTGLGKTIASHYVAHKVGLANALGTNLTPATRIEQLVGMTLPVNGPSGIVLEWADGIVLAAARHGWACLLEEITRSPETMSRLFSVADQIGRSFPTPENPFERSVPVDPRFWLIASGNPVGKGYQTAEMDVALRSRFFIIDCNEPLADEWALLKPLVSEAVATKLMNFVVDARVKGEVYPSTRELVMAAQQVGIGQALKDAVMGAIVLKYPSKRQGLDMLMQAHF